MEYLSENEFLAKCNNLPFSTFEKLEMEKRNTWQKYALQGYQKLQTGNVALVAETSAGKTIMAELIAWGGDLRTIFLTPQRELAIQHQNLLQKIAIPLHKDQTAVFTGVTKREERTWNDRQLQIIFATPQVLLNDFRRNLVNLQSYALLIFDEFHLAVGKYAYVPLAKTAYEQNVRILCLSASPGGTEERIKQNMKNCFVDKDHQIIVMMKVPRKTESLVTIPLDETLKDIERHLAEMLQEAAVELETYGFDIDASRFLTEEQLHTLSTQIEHNQQHRYYYDAISALARYRKLRRATRLILSEGYHSFLSYTQKLLDPLKDKTLAAKLITTDYRFSVVCDLAKKQFTQHPKFCQLVENINSLKRMGENGLLFVAEKETGRFLEDTLQAEGIRTDVFFGGKNKNTKQRHLVLEKLARRKIDFVIATSAAEMGHSIPEIDNVIHYSMPFTEISRIQRSGRTGRTKEGRVIYLCLQHPLDSVFYWKARAGEWRMNLILGKVPPKKFFAPRVRHIVPKENYTGYLFPL